MAKPASPPPPPARAAARPAPPPPARAAAPSRTPTNVPAVQKKGNALALPQAPGFMAQYRGEGAENISSGDIETPRIKLLQAVSPELTTFNEAKSGEFWHSVAEMSLGGEVRVTPIYVDQRAILWRPRWDGNGGILARSDDGIHWSPPNGKWSIRPSKDSRETVVWETRPTVAESGLLEWGTHNPSDPESPPAATRMYTVVFKLIDFPELPPAVVTLQRSGIKPARKFLGKLKMSTAPTYGLRFVMKPFQDGTAAEPFWNYQFDSDGFVETEEEFHANREWYENFKRLGLNIRDLEGAQDEGASGGTTIDGKTGGPVNPNAPRY